MYEGGSNSFIINQCAISSRWFHSCSLFAYLTVATRITRVCENKK